MSDREERDQLTHDLCELRKALWGLEQEMRAALEIQWSPSPNAGVHAFDVPGVALEERRLRVRAGMQQATAVIRHATVLAGRETFNLNKSLGGWYGTQGS